MINIDGVILDLRDLSDARDLYGYYKQQGGTRKLDAYLKIVFEKFDPPETVCNIVKDEQINKYWEF